jgi:glycosyltransferase involved in cell wall biosynthesis
MLRWYLPVRWMLPRRPAFLTFHGYEGYPIPLEARLLRRIAGRAALGSICMGEFICKWYRCRCDAVSYGGVDASAEVPEPREDTAVFIGRLEPDTGIAEIIEALRLLREGGRSLPLTVCGDGSLRARLENAARAAGIQAEFVGRVAEPRAYLLQARYAFVTGFLAILEAMACRRLVLSIYDTPIKRDYLELFPARDAIVIAGSAGELAARLAERLDAPERSRELLDRAQAFAHEQTWRKVAETYLHVYAAHGVTV